MTREDEIVNALDEFVRAVIRDALSDDLIDSLVVYRTKEALLALLRPVVA